MKQKATHQELTSELARQALMFREDGMMEAGQGEGVCCTCLSKLPEKFRAVRDVTILHTLPEGF